MATSVMDAATAEATVVAAVAGKATGTAAAVGGVRARVGKAVVVVGTEGSCRGGSRCRASLVA